MRAFAAVSMMLVLATASAAGAQQAEGTDADTTANANPDTNADPDANPDANPDPDTSVDADTDASTDADAPSGATDEDPDEADDEEDVVVPTARWSEERVIGWATMTASMAVGIAGGILLAVGVDDVNSIENAPDGTLWSAVEANRDRAPILTGIGAVMLGLGTAGVAVSAGLLAYFGNQGTWISVTVLPNGVSASGRF